ncbi:uncharacterized protein [Periplaneta americana]|uniref:uncharacterized protein isoform X2 n=1 Tax=Periplaneta americana TaxID=6978 RepID=UPI0037E92B3D
MAQQFVFEFRNLTIIRNYISVITDLANCYKLTLYFIKHVRTFFSKEIHKGERTCSSLYPVELGDNSLLCFPSRWCQCTSPLIYKKLNILAAVSSSFGEQREEQLRKLKEQMKTLCHVDIQYQDATASLKVVQDTLKKKKEKRKRKENFMEVDDDSDDDEAADKEINIQELYKKKMEERSSRRSNINNHSRYITFKNNIERILKQVDVDIDEDIAITESDVNTIDPITKRPIQDPVRIRLCGHVFDRMSIMSILKGKHNIRLGLG